MPANIFHLVLNIALESQLLSRHLTTPGHIPQSKNSGWLHSEGWEGPLRHSKYLTGDICSKIASRYRNSWQHPRGHSAWVACRASRCELASPWLSFWLSIGRDPTCHLLQPPGDVSFLPLSCSSPGSYEESTVGDSLIAGEATFF